jgi:hypothetical protein
MVEQTRETVQKKIKDLETKIGDLECRLNHLQSSGFQLANFYFVFQGVILTAIANGASSLRCSDRWFLFILSLLAALLNLVSLFVIGLKYNRTLAERGRSWIQCNELHTLLSNIEENLLGTTPGSIFVDHFTKSLRTFCLGLCMSLFLSVSIIMIVACWTILCRREDSECKHPSYVNDKCFRLCNGTKCLSICGVEY